MRESCFFFLQMFTLCNCLQVGAADYIAVAKNYHTVFISDIPVMSMRIRDKVSYSCAKISTKMCQYYN